MVFIIIIKDMKIFWAGKDSLILYRGGTGRRKSENSTEEKEITHTKVPN